MYLEIPLLDAVKMMTATPAKLICVDAKKGYLAIGKDADIVMFDDDINISKVIVSGEVRS